MDSSVSRGAVLRSLATALTAYGMSVPDDSWARMGYYFVVANIIRMLLVKVLGILFSVCKLRNRYRVGRMSFLITIAALAISVPFLISSLVDATRSWASRDCCELVIAELPMIVCVGGEPDKLVVTSINTVWLHGLSVLVIAVTAVGAFLVASLQKAETDNLMITSIRPVWRHALSILATAVTTGATFLVASLPNAESLWQFLILWVFDWLYYVYQDYLIMFKDLGRGGSAPTFKGWALARLRATTANVDVMQPPRIHPMLDPYNGRLNNLPRREGQRPSILGVTPQRQVDFRAPPNTQLHLERMMQELIREPAAVIPGEPEDGIEIRPSFPEPGLLALRRVLTVPTTNDDRGGPLDAPASWNGPDEFGSEIAHAHRDGTSHIVLHPADVRAVIEGGWGERHPFYTTSWYWKLYFHWYLGIRLPVPPGLVIVYAPRHQGEYDVIRELFTAAVWNETGGRLFPLTADTYPIPSAPAA